MKILLVNKFYYRRGGDCIYTLNLEQLLSENGHEVAVFAMDYPDNLDTKWSKYFPSEVKFRPGPGIIEAILRPFGTSEVKRKFNAMLDDFNPDVVHLNNIHSQLSPIIAEIAHKRGIRVVWTIHDCKLVCPRYDCMRGGTRCELCADNAKYCLKYKCMKDSWIASLIGYLEAKKWSASRLENISDIFLCPSKYMADTMLKGHFNKKKIRVLCNFIDIGKVSKPDYDNKQPYYCYIGRLSKEKGVYTLLKAASALPYKLIIIGGGPLEQELRSDYGKYSNIEFSGQLDWKDLRPILNNALFSVLPSECAENNPLTVIESLCLGTPVLGARIGGIPELIDEKNGMTFNSGDLYDLRDKIKEMFETSFDYRIIASEAQNKYSSKNYYSHLMQLYLDE